MGIVLNVCPKCGGTKYDKNKAFDVDGKGGAKMAICRKCGCGIFIEVTEDFEKKFEEDCKKAAQAQAEAKQPPKIECPYCHSTATRKISGTSRVVSAGLFGLGSKKIGKQWHCCSCKSDF